MRFALIGILFLGLAILFYDKHFDRLKVLCYYIAIVFVSCPCGNRGDGKKERSLNISRI